MIFPKFQNLLKIYSKFTFLQFSRLPKNYTKTWEVGTEARWGQWIVRWQWDVFWEEAEAEEHAETGEDDQEDEEPDKLQ